jgi:hypothetical protein
MSQEDRAQDHEAMDWALNNRPRDAAPMFAECDKGYGPATCNGREKRTGPGVQLEDDCGNELPPLRRAMGRHLCVACQDLLERGRLLN